MQKALFNKQILLFISLALLSFRCQSQTDLSPNDKQLFSEITTYVEKTLDALQPVSAGIVISRNQEIIFEKYLSGSQPQPPVTIIDEHSLWPIFSCTKSFISALILSLATDGRLNLDDPVYQYLPEFATAGPGDFSRRLVTIRHLASHTSGMQLTRISETDFLQSEAIDLNDIQVTTEPGQDFLYSALGMHVLERLLEQAGEADLETLLQQRILEPLKLKSTRYIYAYDSTLNLLPCKANDFADPTLYFEFARKGHRAGSGLYTATRDLNRFGQLWLSDGTFEGHRYFSPELKTEAWKYHGIRASDQGRYGLLWWLFEDAGGYVISGASHSLTAVVPQTQVVITVTRNHVGKYPGPFNYYQDKKTLVEFGGKL